MSVRPPVLPHALESVYLFALTLFRQVREKIGRHDHREVEGPRVTDQGEVRSTLQNSGILSIDDGYRGYSLESENGE